MYNQCTFSVLVLFSGAKGQNTHNYNAKVLIIIVKKRQLVPTITDYPN